MKRYKPMCEQMADSALTVCGFRVAHEMLWDVDFDTAPQMYLMVGTGENYHTAMQIAHCYDYVRVCRYSRGENEESWSLSCFVGDGSGADVEWKVWSNGLI